jgi:hypothetical protein
MHEPSGDQLADRSFRGVLRIAAFGIAVKNEDQLVHGQASRVFIEEER